MRINKTVTLGLLVGLALGAGTAFADDIQFSGLTAQWWQVITSIPTTVNPLVDTTGADCMVGQRGPVWFLTGSFFGGTVTRNCTIPAGEWLFFPVVNLLNDNIPNCNQGPGNLSVETLRSQIVAYVDGATNLSVKVDGQPVKNVRVKSVPFAFTIPKDNIFGSNPCGTNVPLPAGVYSPAIDDGFYTLLPPLSAGHHTLHIYGQLPTFGVTDVTYNLTIVPVLLE